MFDEDVCPNCESSNTKFVHSIEMFDGSVCDYFECQDCGCKYHAVFVRVLTDVDVDEDEDI